MVASTLVTSVLELFPCTQKQAHFKLNSTSVFPHIAQVADSWVQNCKGLIIRDGWLSKETQWIFSTSGFHTHCEWGKVGTNKSSVFLFNFYYFSHATQVAKFIHPYKEISEVSDVACTASEKRNQATDQQLCETKGKRILTRGCYESDILSQDFKRSLLEH